VANIQVTWQLSSLMWSSSLLLLVMMASVMAFT
jgi:hypothetical protein